MLIKSRDYVKKSLELSPKTIYIFCEGKKREYDYFTKRLIKRNSKIKLEVYKLKDTDDNSPTGLFTIADTSFQAKKITIDEVIDEVWFVIDTDRWGTKINEIREMCSVKNNWFIAQSNPCFEVWLYYHFKEEKITEKELAIFDIKTKLNQCKTWKQYIPHINSGGFDSNRHLYYIDIAINNSKKNFELCNDSPSVGSTEMHILAKDIKELVLKKREHSVKLES